MTGWGDFVLAFGWEHSHEEFVKRIEKGSARESRSVINRGWRFGGSSSQISFAHSDACKSESRGADVMLSLVQNAPGSDSETGLLDGLFTALKSENMDGVADSVKNFQGNFASCVFDSEKGHLLIASDPFSKIPLFLKLTENSVICATDLRLISVLMDERPQISSKSVYDFLNFFYIPAPRTVFKGIEKLRPGYVVIGAIGNRKESVYWRPTYPANRDEPMEFLAKELEGQLATCLHNYVGPNHVSEGAFLSGGTDSSTLVGLIRRIRNQDPVKTFSIGFSEDLYDETRFARIAAEAFDATGDFHHISAAEALETIPALIDGFDEPFGNPSVIGTLICLRRAKSAGINSMIAGDGGDEVFGGNERYAKDRWLGMFFNAPSIVKWPVRSMANLLEHTDTFFGNRIKNFAGRGSLPNPDRLYADDSFASDYYGDLLTAEFRSAVSIGSSLDLVRKVYSECEGRAAEIHKLMYVDLQLAIAENDLIKVGRASRIVNISTHYPFLDQRIVDYTGHLPATAKLRRGQKRYLFLKAVEKLLPVEIRNKKKQGFGLPVSLWFRENPDFKSMLHDIVLSQKAIERGYFNEQFVRKIIERHSKGSWDFGQPLWALLMLELWHQSIEGDGI